MSLLALLDHTLLGDATRTAIDVQQAGGETASFTFGDLERRSNQLARALDARGIRRGDRLAFLLGNRIEIVDLWLACAK
ncbi:MAG TPA: AMP-binding protein, partial [Gemmatimonadaceae bacterium]|nr:AMP-binding protein [Gemmatimonadaceae bacterium]